MNKIIQKVLYWSSMHIGGYNHKGLFMRQRQPNAAALLMKSRYEQLELVQIKHIPTRKDYY